MLTSEQRAIVHEAAHRAARLWGRGEAAVEHIAESGNSVWLLEGGGERTILRLTNPAYRTRSENEAETEYLRFLEAEAVRVAAPIASANGIDVEEIHVDGVMLAASCFRWADGHLVTRETEFWNERFFRAWGEALGRIHQASVHYEPSGAARRWQWSEEILIREAPALIPANEIEIHEELAVLTARVDALPTDRSVYGMVHADFAPQNFRYDPLNGITAFDFGNCCYHWYASDLAISLSVLRAFPRTERDRYRSWLMAGYLLVRPDAHEEFAWIALFLRFRILYVYLSRLMKFGAAPTDEERAILERLRGFVLERYDWEASP